jgi:hypothetical protein
MKENLSYWIRKWDLNEELIYKNAAIEQASFVRDKICGNLLKSQGFVVSTHHSKSCLLPVYYIKARNGIKLIMRCNFYDWKLSVDIPDEWDGIPTIPLDCLSHHVIEHGFEKIASCYCEGFKEEWCYDAYDPHHPGNKFTIEIPDNYRLYVVIHYLKHTFPDVSFNVELDKRTVNEIKTDIDKILDANGFNNWYDDKFLGIQASRRRMRAWEILWRTYIKIENLYYDRRITAEEFPSISINAMDFAKFIIRYPEVHAEFLMEEWMYNDNI